MTSVESFQAVAASGAAAGILAMLVPTRAGGAPPARLAAALAMTVASWILLVGSLVSRANFDKIVDRIGSPVRTGALLVGAALGVAVVLLLARICIRRPVVWLVMVAATLPIRVPVSIGGDLGGNLLVPLYVVIVVGIVALAWGRAQGRLAPTRLHRSPFDVPLALFTAFSLASLWWSGDVNEGTTKAVFFYIPFILLYRLVLSWWPLATEPLRAVALTTLVMAVPIATIALAQFATRTIWWNDTLKQGNVYNRFFRANGTFYDPNILGRYLVVALAITVAYAIASRRPRVTLGLGIAAAVLSAGLAVTFSRSSALALMVVVTLLAVRTFGVRRTALVGVAALVLVGGPVVALNSHVRDRVSSVTGVTSAGEGRFRLARGGIDLWKTEPVTGVGLGAFAAKYKETLPRKQAVRTRVFISHTAPITVLAELGIVGIGLLALLLGTATVVLWRGARHDRNGAGLVQWTVLAVLVAIFVHSLLYSAFFEDPYVWVMAAVGLAVGATRPVEAAHEATQTLPVIVPATG
jgi:putative inorganic carbon (hco3(-)) transporter